MLTSRPPLAPLRAQTAAMMNIFRLSGDISHVLAIFILLAKIWTSRSAAGASGPGHGVLLLRLRMVERRRRGGEEERGEGENQWQRLPVRVASTCQMSLS